jgi:hypothetical protein
MGVPRPDVGKRIHRRGLMHGDIVAKRAEIPPDRSTPSRGSDRVIAAATLCAE